jgi:hypothetical protein
MPLEVVVWEGYKLYCMLLYEQHELIKYAVLTILDIGVYQGWFFHHSKVHGCSIIHLIIGVIKATAPSP